MSNLRIYSSEHTLKSLLKEIPYTLKRSKRRRSFMITINPQAQVTVYAPFFLTLEKTFELLEKKREWVFRKQEQILKQKKSSAEVSFKEGSSILYLGRLFPIKYCEQQPKSIDVELANDECLVKIDWRVPEQSREIEVKKSLIDWYRKEAYKIIVARVDIYAPQLDVYPERILVKTQKRIWGVCHHYKKSIHFNWQMIMAPLESVDYVVVHELAHLIEPNHSSRFWKHVHRILPDYKIRQQALKALPVIRI